MCRAEAPHLSKLEEKYGARGLVVIGVNIDNDSAARVRKFSEQKNLGYKMLLRGEGVAFNDYWCRAFPTIYWIDPSGKVRGRDYGYQSFDRLEERARGFLAP
jgi:thiol-disulfide isomerase/thioredoxin